ncbi:MAG: periplasmic protein CpxP/Spy [Gammaproteobacteria bacterium]|jgi:Spy/CpxP family protein refolding chaperone|nr:periplasmic protein CpxP/Spy [Gammaproteobacteria bacterium]
MKSIRNVLAGTLLAGGVLLSAATSFSIANAADDAAATPPAAARGPGHHGSGPERLFSKLGLSAEQKASIKTLFTTAKPQMKSLHEQLRANHLKLMQTKPDDPNYAHVVAEVAQSNATLASQRTTQRAELKAQMYAVLTPAQKTQLATLEAQWAANPHHGRWGRHGPHAGDAQPAPAG